jgi:site-specific DNA recombinase
MNKEYSKAVIYCRVSSEKQVREGNGLESQEHRCREYAQSLGLEVEQVFLEEGVSGGLFDRPAMKSLIGYLDSHWQRKYCVIFDDLKRFARDVEVHLRLKSELRCREAKLCCLNYSFDESAEGEFVETIFAAQNELERKQNRRQVCQKMKARLERGYWCFQTPIGYGYIKDKDHGKIIAPIPEITSIITQAMELFADESLYRQVDVFKFLKSKNFCELIGLKRLKLDHVKAIFTQPLYAGIIEYRQWEVSRRKGHHKAIISVDTFDKIQQRLKRPERKPRETDKLEFPLRRLVNCSVCGKKMTGSVNRGKSKYYAHYTCNNKECKANPKNITASKVEEDYIKLLSDITVDDEVLKVGLYVAQKIWKEKAEQIEEFQKSNEKKRAELLKQIDEYIDLIPRAKTESVKSRYEQKVEMLDSEIREIDLLKKNKKMPDINEALKLTLKFLGTPAETWKNSNKQLKILLHSMIFAENPSYCLNTGFGTPKLSLPFMLKQHVDGQNGDLVELRGVAPLSKRKKQYFLQAYQ